MPYSILIRALDNTHPDPDIDRSGCYKKGDIVHIAEPLHIWGTKEGLPGFIQVNVTDGISAAVALSYRDQWQSDLQYSVVSADTVNDAFTLTITNANNGASGAADLTAAMMSNFLTAWGAKNISATPNVVQFDITIFDAIKSPEFWDNPASLQIVFNQTAYDQVTGTHTITANYSALTGVNPKAVEGAVVRHDGVVTSNANSIITFTITRATVRQAFQDDVASKAHFVYKRRRYSIAPADVDTVIGMGGIFTTTQAVLLSKLKDAMA